MSLKLNCKHYNVYDGTQNNLLITLVTGLESKGQEDIEKKSGLIA